MLQAAQHRTSQIEKNSPTEQTPQSRQPNRYNASQLRYYASQLRYNASQLQIQRFAAGKQASQAAGYNRYMIRCSPQPHPSWWGDGSWSGHPFQFWKFSEAQRLLPKKRGKQSGSRESVENREALSPSKSENINTERSSSRSAVIACRYFYYIAPSFICFAERGRGLLPLRPYKTCAERSSSRSAVIANLALLCSALQLLYSDRSERDHIPLRPYSRDAPPRISDSHSQPCPALLCSATLVQWAEKSGATYRYVLKNS